MQTVMALPNLDGGKPGSQLFQRLNEQEIMDIMSCLDQFCKHYAKTRPDWFSGFFTIMVWFPEDANSRFPNPTPMNSYKLLPKLEVNFVSKSLLNLAMRAYALGQIPVEIVRGGTAKFYALLRSEVMAGDIETMMFSIEEMSDGRGDIGGKYE